jgi:hypothetical protein
MNSRFAWFFETALEVSKGKWDVCGPVVVQCALA